MSWWLLDAKFFRQQPEDKPRAAAAVDAGYPDNEGLVIDLETGYQGRMRTVPTLPGRTACSTASARSPRP